MIAKPIAASAAATVNMNKANTCPLRSFKKIEKEKGIEECFFIREVHDDVSAIIMYLEYEDFKELNLFSYFLVSK